jgi:predicted nucleic acid-binding protein
MKVFIDSDVILDVIRMREPFLAHSALVLDLAARRTIIGLTSSVVIANVYYVSKKQDEAIRDILDYITVLPTTHEMMIEAFNSKYRDKEDAIQYVTAVRGKAKYLVTRNTRDHEASDEIRVVTPGEFLNIKSIKTR